MHWHTPRAGTVVLEANTEVTNRDVSNADFANIHSSTIRIEVSDTGVGIPTEALPRVFDRLPRRFIALPEFRGHGIGIGYRSEYCRASRRRCGDFQPTGTGRTRNTPHAGILIRIFLSEVTKVDEPRRRISRATRRNEDPTGSLASRRSNWWRRVDSNHGPTDYETVALTT